MAELHAGGAVHDEGVLEPACVIPCWEILPEMAATALFAGQCADRDCLGDIEQIPKLKRFHEFGVEGLPPIVHPNAGITVPQRDEAILEFPQSTSRPEDSGKLHHRFL